MSGTREKDEVLLMINKILLISICCLMLCPAIVALGFDDNVTHPDVTERAIFYSDLNDYLKTSLDFANGVQTHFPSDSQDANSSIMGLLKQGSTDEDSPSCRASNHFHNPLAPWDLSFLTDDIDYISTRYIKPFCTATGWFGMNRRPDITWATGYLFPAPGEAVRGWRGA